MNKDENKRKSKRLSCAVPLDGKKGSVFESTNVVDISKGGLGFVSSHRIPLNQKIPIELDLYEDDNPVFVIGKVTWSQAIKGSSNYRIGVTFEDVLHGSKMRLKKYFS